MDTILYFYQTEEKNETAILEKYREAGYLLIRAGISCAFLHALEQAQEELLQCREEKEKSLWQKLFSLREKGKRQKQTGRIGAFMRQQMQALGQQIEPLVEYPNDCFYVYEDGLEKTVFAGLWQKHCAYLELKRAQYIQGAWVEEQILDGKLADYVIVGYEEMLLRPLWKKASRLKSLRWIITRKEYGDRIIEFIEDLELEYGLLTNLEVLGREKDYAGLVWRQKTPVKLIDATGEAPVRLAGLPEGTLYEDLYSVSQKQRQIEERGLPIAYQSIKKRWKHWQKDAALLDTTGKNGYNTLVNRDFLEKSETENIGE